MHLIRQFLESLALGLGVGLILVFGAIYFLDSQEPAGSGTVPGAVSVPTEEATPQRDEEGVPLQPEASQVLQGVIVSDERVG